jgi:hypothetical protein
VFHLKREVEGQPLGIVTSGNTAEIREIVPTSPAGQHGMTPKIRSFDGQTLVPWVLTEINGRPLNLFSKDGEAGDRLQVSILSSCMQLKTRAPGQSDRKSL